MSKLFIGWSEVDITPDAQIVDITAKAFGLGAPTGVEIGDRADHRIAYHLSYRIGMFRTPYCCIVHPYRRIHRIHVQGHDR